MTVTSDIDCWQTSASEALQDIWFGTSTKRPSKDWLETIDYLIPDMEELTDDPVWLVKTFIGIGSCVTVNNETLTFSNVLDTLVAKQRDYGHGNILRYGLTGVVVRLADKVERLKNLLGSGERPNNESIDDTALDIVGYCTIAVMLLNGSFTKELA